MALDQKKQIAKTFSELNDESKRCIEGAQNLAKYSRLADKGWVVETGAYGKSLEKSSRELRRVLGKCKAQVNGMGVAIMSIKKKFEGDKFFNITNDLANLKKTLEVCIDTLGIVDQLTDVTRNGQVKEPQSLPINCLKILDRERREMTSKEAELVSQQQKVNERIIILEHRISIQSWLQEEKKDIEDKIRKQKEHVNQLRRSQVETCEQLSKTVLSQEVTKLSEMHQTRLQKEMEILFREVDDKLEKRRSVHESYANRGRFFRWLSSGHYNSSRELLDRQEHELREKIERCQARARQQIQDMRTMEIEDIQSCIHRTSVVFNSVIDLQNKRLQLLKADLEDLQMELNKFNEVVEELKVERARAVVLEDSISSKRDEILSADREVENGFEAMFGVENCPKLLRGIEIAEDLSTFVVSMTTAHRRTQENSVEFAMSAKGIMMAIRDQIEQLEVHLMKSSYSKEDLNQYVLGLGEPFAEVAGDLMNAKATVSMFCDEDWKDLLSEETKRSLKKVHLNELERLRKKLADNTIVETMITNIGDLITCAEI
eukprot:TRINITY_DN80011_c0_g1_i1.p1 TRINITY_DN80011_c0_g1~~TRINITY_DN80011_c0_g1_i1.p1  ORF type:complete len:554 (+),score=145.97 TRINITY_DN80011_c0_g1_i1:28-1662(+)